VRFSVFQSADDKASPTFVEAVTPSERLNQVSIDGTRTLFGRHDEFKKQKQTRKERPSCAVIAVEGMELILEPNMVLFMDSLSLRGPLIGFKIFSWRIRRHQGHTGQG